MNKIICLIGLQGSGKDTIQNILVQDMNLYKMISCTDRPMRSNEQNNKDYHFVDEDTMKNYIKNNQLIEYRTYHTIQNGKPAIWTYGLLKTEPSSNLDNIAIVDVEGAKSILNYFGRKNVILIYINCPYQERKTRCMLRSTNFEMDEFNRREKTDFKTFEEFKDDCNLIVNNKNGDLIDACDTIKKYILLLKIMSKADN